MKRKTQNTLLLIGAAAVGYYLVTRRSPAYAAEGPGPNIGEVSMTRPRDSVAGSTGSGSGSGSNPGDVVERVGETIVDGISAIAGIFGAKDPDKINMGQA